MAIARVFDARWSAAQYDEVMAKVGERLRLAAGRSAPGVLFHWVAATDDGVRFVDVYESHHVADDLAQEHITPIVAELGLPRPEIFEYVVREMRTP